MRAGAAASSECVPPASSFVEHSFDVRFPSYSQFTPHFSDQPRGQCLESLSHFTGNATHHTAHLHLMLSAFQPLIALQISFNDDAHTRSPAASSHHRRTRRLHQRSRGSSSRRRSGAPQAAQHGAGAQRCAFCANALETLHNFLSCSTSVISVV